MGDGCGMPTPGLSRRRVLHLAGVAAGGLALTAAGRPLREAPMARGAQATPIAGEGAVAVWNYEPGTGPEDWGHLHSNYATCTQGVNQSPIDITAPDSVALANIEVDYQTVSPLLVVNNGKTILVPIPNGKMIEVDQHRYELRQFHFHTPSEHTIAGEAQAMELHLVHAAADQTIAVVSVLLAEGAEHPALKPVFAALPRQPNAQQQVNAAVDLLALLPEQRTTYHYEGSLTTPPCSEGVRWYLFTVPVEVSAEQVEAFRAVIGENARPTQPLNDRPVVEDSTR